MLPKNIYFTLLQRKYFIAALLQKLCKKMGTAHANDFHFRMCDVMRDVTEHTTR